MIDVTAASKFIPSNPNPAQIAMMEQMLAAQTQTAQPGQHPSAGLSLKKIAVEQSEPLRLEIASFLHSVRTRTTPQVTAEEGRAALALALEINEAIAAHAIRAGI